MNEFFNSPLFHLMLTLVLYKLCYEFYKKYKYKIFHPGMITIILLIVYMKISGTSFEDYNNNTQIISFWLGPSVVALGLPLYLYIRQLKGNYLKVLLAMVCGSISGIVSAVTIAWLLGADDYVLNSMGAKSITTPIAMEISRGLGGSPSLTLAVVFITGFIGALFGWGYLKLLKVTDDTAIGVATGASSHAVGTAEIVKKGENFGAFGALGMALNGILTAILAPLIMPYLLKILHFIF